MDWVSIVRNTYSNGGLPVNRSIRHINSNTIIATNRICKSPFRGICNNIIKNDSQVVWVNTYEPVIIQVKSLSFFFNIHSMVMKRLNIVFVRKVMLRDIIYITINIYNSWRFPMLLIYQIGDKIFNLVYDMM